jgi:hypothetical protein
MFVLFLSIQCCSFVVKFALRKINFSVQYRYFFAYFSINFLRSTGTGMPLDRALKNVFIFLPKIT